MNWIILPDHTYTICPNVLLHEVRCPKCHTQETYIGDKVPDMCYICEEKRTMPEVK